MPRKRPEGVTCEACGHFEPFVAWVYAHWDIPLVYTCTTEGCGAKYETIAGTITRLENEDGRSTQDE